MKTKVILILLLIVVLIMLSLSAVALVGGFRDEAEASWEEIDAGIAAEQARILGSVEITVAKPEPMFEFVPYSTSPTSEGAIWLESSERPPLSIFYYEGDRKIEYVPKPELDEPKKVSLDFIPTWPDYIELDEDLIIQGHPDIHNIGEREVDLSLRIELSKGTKIYFRED